MTIADARTGYTSASGDGVSVAFNYSFRCESAQELRVSLREADGSVALQTLTTHYTATYGVSGGTVTFVTPPGATQKVEIERDTDDANPLVLGDSERFPNEDAERQMDRLAMQAGDARRLAGRAITVPPGETDRGFELPPATLRAGKFLSFSSTGSAVAETRLLDIGAGSALDIGMARSFEQFGAVGDEDADDTSAIQDAIDWSNEGPGRCLLLTPGKRYAVSAPLLSQPESTSNLTWFSWNAERASIVRFDDYGHTLVIGDPDTLAYSSGACHFENVTFDHRQSYTAGDTALDNPIPLNPDARHIVMYGGQAPVFRNMRFKNLGGHIDFYGVTLSLIEGCRSDGIYDPQVAALQHTQRAIRYLYSATHGHCKDADVVHSHFAGNLSPARSVSGFYSAASYAENVGPQTFIEAQSLETGTFIGNRFGGAARETLWLNNQDRLLNLTFAGNWFDGAGAKAVTSDAAAGKYNLDCQFLGNRFRGADNSLRAFEVNERSGGGHSAVGWQVLGNHMLAYLLCPNYFKGTTDMLFANNVVGDYNSSNYGNPAAPTDCAGMYVPTTNDAFTSMGNVWGGGGAESSADTAVNHCKWGPWIDAKSGSTMALERLARGGLGLAGGSLVAGGTVMTYPVT